MIKIIKFFSFSSCATHKSPLLWALIKKIAQTSFLIIMKEKIKKNLNRIILHKEKSDTDPLEYHWSIKFHKRFSSPRAETIDKSREISRKSWKWKSAKRQKNVTLIVDLIIKKEAWAELIWRFYVTHTFCGRFHMT